MPRGWRPPQTEAERFKGIEMETSKIIRKYMIERDIKTVLDLAPQVCICYSTLKCKMNNGGWTQKDLFKIIEVLKITPEDAVVLLGLKKARPA